MLDISFSGLLALLFRRSCRRLISDIIFNALLPLPLSCANAKLYVLKNSIHVLDSLTSASAVASTLYSPVPEYLIVIIR